MYNKKLTVTHGVTVYTNAMAHPDELGTAEQISKPIDEFYGLIPFPSAINELIDIKIYHMDHPELMARRAAGEYTVLDLDLGKSGFQNVLAFHFLKRLELGVYPPNWVAEYLGPARHILESSLAVSLNCLLHELGHFYQGICKSSGDIDRLITALINQYSAGQNQASNQAEWFAEIVVACVRGKFSDNNPANIDPGLYSLMRCMYFLAIALRDRTVVSLTPQATGCMYQTRINGAYYWRFYAWTNWTHYEHDWFTNQWKKI